jgi:hypothetical protein
VRSKSCIIFFIQFILVVSSLSATYWMTKSERHARKIRSTGEIAAKVSLLERVFAALQLVEEQQNTLVELVHELALFYINLRNRL